MDNQKYQTTDVGPVLTVVMPTYNEEKLIESAVKEVQEHILDQIDGSRLIVVDGGSTDDSINILNQLTEKDNRIELVYQPGCKHGPSLILGINKATGNHIFILDSDRQIPIECFSQLWRLKDSYDAILGVRTNRQDPRLRLIISFVAASIIKVIFSVNVPDANAPFKLFKRSIWQDMVNRLGAENLPVPSVFFSIYARTRKYKVIDVPVEHKARDAGVSIRVDRILLSCLAVLSTMLKYRNKFYRD